mmetsp:Transcript_58458/g.189372  ORF Transcript_58458/g.189372 Transcript_58458/m.189372 type:complete len:189 (+) Transcript_58458:128-694(+)
MPPVKGVELEVTEGITEHSSRVALKGVFQNFGDVVACWVPPIDRRHVDRASVRFGNAASAEAAKASCDAGQVFLQGLPVKVDFRMGGGRRVGNSDLGESGNKNDEGKARAIMDDSANNGGGGGGGGGSMEGWPVPPVPGELLALAWESDRWRRRSEEEGVRVSEWESFSAHAREVFARHGLEARPWHG